MGRVLRRLATSAAFAVLVASCVVAFVAPEAAQAIATCDNGVTAQNNIKVAPSHGQVFYVDSAITPAVNAGYVGYQVTNSSASPMSDLWVKLGNFTGNALGLANPLDESFQISSLAASATAPSFFFLKATGATSTAQTHSVSVYQGDPRLASSSLLYSCTYTFTKVKETIQANSNKFDETGFGANNAQVAIDNSSPQLGQTVTLTVEGQTGQIGNGTAPDNDMIWLVPAAVSSWPTRALRLEAVSVIFDKDNKWGAGNTADQTTYTNVLFIGGASTVTNIQSSNYRASYTFRVIGKPTSSVQTAPIAQIASGSQIKHTTKPAAGYPTISFSSVSVNATLAKTVTSSSISEEVSCSSNSCSAWGGANGTTYLGVPYRLTLTNSGSQAISVDEIVDTPNTGVFLKPNSATVTDATRSAQSIAATFLSAESGLASPPVHFTGPFGVNGSNGTAIVNYTMYVPKNNGTYVNTAYALIGDVKVGASATTIPKVSVTTNNTSTVSSSSSTASLSLDAQTAPATAIDTTVATLNAVAYPNGNTGTAQFEYGTNSLLTGATTVTATTPASGSLSGSSAVNVAVNLTGLSAGTTYYFRIKVGSVYGTILSFDTVAVQAPPTVTTGAATPVSSTAATLVGSINPNLSTINAVLLKYALNSGLSSSLVTVNVGDPDDSSIAWLPAGSSVQSSSKTVAGLTANTTYYYAFVACTGSVSGTYPNLSCSGTTVAGSTLSFTTSAAVTVSTSSLPDAPKLGSYATTLAATGGTGTYTTWAVTAGSLPSGLALNSATGVISGTTASGATSQTFSVQATDSLGIVSVAKELTITVTAVAQTIDFAPISNTSFSATPFNITPTASSGLVVALTSATPSYCSVDPPIAGAYAVTMLAGGTCTLNADQAGDATYAAATRVSQSFTISKLDQSITWGAAASGHTYGDSSFDPSLSSDASRDGAGSVSWVVDATSSTVCSISAGKITMLTGGNCKINATHNGNGKWKSISDNRTFVIGKKTQAVSVAASATGWTYGASDFDPLVSTDVPLADDGSSSLLAWSVDSASSSVCSKTVDNKIRMLSNGDCIVNASHPGNSRWSPGTASQTFKIKKNQTIAIAASTTGWTVGDSDFDPGVSSDATADGGSLSWSVGPSGVCVKSGSNVQMVSNGDCVLTASHPGNDLWNAKSSTTKTFKIKKNQTIAIGASSTGYNVGDSDFDPGVSSDATADGGSLSWSVGPSGVCVKSGSKIQVISNGDCALSASHPGNDLWNSGANSKTFVIKKNQTINFVPTTKSKSSGSYDATLDVSTDATEGGAFGFTTGAGISSICTVTAQGLVTLKATGTCVINVSHPGSTHWNAGTTTASFVINDLKDQTIAIAASATGWTVNGDDFDPGVSSDASGDGGSLSWSVGPSSVCVKSGVKIQMVSNGDCVLTASHNGNANWNPGSGSKTFKIKKNQTIAIAASATGWTVTEADFDPQVSSDAASAGGTLSWSVGPSSVCVKSGVKIQMVSNGDCELTASHPGNDLWNAKSAVTKTFKIKKNQTIAIAASATGWTVGGSDFDPGVSSDASTDDGVTPLLGWSIDPSSVGICTVTVDNKIKMLSNGDCIVNASHSGNTKWNAGSGSKTFKIKKNQTIAIGASATGRTVGDADFDPSVSSDAVADGGAVTWTVDAASSAVCAEVSGKIRMLNAGACVVNATHGGNSKWESGNNSKTFVIKKNQTVTFDASVSGGNFGDDDFDPSATTPASADGGAVTYAVEAGSTSVCSIVAGKIRILGAGTCQVRATHGGNTLWNSSNQLKSFTIGKKGQSVGFTLDDKTLGDPDFDVSAKPTTNATGGGAFTFTSSTATVCTVTSSGTVSLVDTGTCTISANHPGNTNWSAGVKAASFTVKAKPAAPATTAPATTTTTTVAAPVTPPCEAPKFDATVALSALQATAFKWTPSVTAGTTTLKWSVVSGAIPAGLALNEKTGEISGKPTNDGVAEFALEATTTECSGTAKTGRTTVTMTVDPTSTVAGILWFDLNKNDRREKNEPLLPGATVRLDPNGNVTVQSVRASDTARSTVTDKNGAYSFEAVPVGEYVVAVVVPKTASIVGSWEPDGKADFRIPVNVKQNTSTDIEVAVTGGTRTGGTAVNLGTNSIIPNAPVTCTWAGIDDTLGTDDDVKFETTTKSDGTYVLDGIPVGKFSCSTFDKSVGKASESATVKVTQASATTSIEKLTKTVLRVKGTKVPATGTDADLHVRLALLFVLLGAALVLVGEVRGRRRRLDLGS